MALAGQTFGQLVRFRRVSLDVRIEFEGMLRDRYEKEMFFIPRRGFDILYKFDARPEPSPSQT